MAEASIGLRCFALALLAAGSASCGGGPEARSGSVLKAPDAPSTGTILYYEPASEEGLKKRKTRPVTQIFTTGQGDLAEESSFHTYSGTVEGVSRGQSLSEQEMQAAIQRMMQRTNAGATRVLSPDRFKVLWDRVAAAGLFELPRFAGKERPEDRPHFLVKTGEKTWIFARPPAEPKEESDTRRTPSQIWTAVTLVFVDFVNER